MLARLLLCVACVAGLAAAQNDLNAPFPPHRIADNLYYVGSKGLATYLIVTPQGDILINSGYERTVPVILGNMLKLGFKPTDVKILLASHAHGDHVEGMATLKEETGGRVFVMQGDDQVMAKGGEGQYLYKDHWAPVKVDRVLHDGDTVTLGNTTLTAHWTPGHTRGCTTWTWKAKDKGKTYDVVIVGSVNVNPGFQLVHNPDYPEMADDYARTFRVLKSLDCDIFLGAHGAYYGMEEKYAQLKVGVKGNPFVDPQGYRRFVADRENAYLDTLEKQKKP
ncbi:MAG: subclass B3 metallo-beta-lactamase [Acidobacteriia bacterium]|nr:subclass B3 metallo-beta-lactamase [Terriglobia bacterium]